MTDADFIAAMNAQLPPLPPIRRLDELPPIRDYGVIAEIESDIKGAICDERR